ncbi:hypothetical protein FOZG_07384 [Fusarium oxysporum Fo47]|uniref:Uncharacterized protein n=1 Tax=Fusarium oxysporum Fo47 TaxID=660027 RepID=W9KML9_FUSOX|nr:hypothetical protein FOZG_07384 [Fusarium oxysporum Fo47]
MHAFGRVPESSQKHGPSIPYHHPSQACPSLGYCVDWTGFPMSNFTKLARIQCISLAPFPHMRITAVPVCFV